MKLFLTGLFLVTSLNLSAQMVTNASGAPNVCTGVVTRFSYSGACSGGITWRIEPEGGTIVSSTNSYADIRWDTPVSTTYVAVMCSGNNSQNGSTASFQVYAPSTPSVSISGPATICVGSMATYQAAPTNGGTSPTYNWKVNGVSKQTGTSRQFSSNELKLNDVVTVQMTSNIPCATSTSAISNSITITTANQPQHVQVQVTQSGSLCETDATQNVTFNAMPTNGGNNPTFKWYRTSYGDEPVQDNELPANGSAYKPHYELVNGERVWCVMTSSLDGCLSNNPAKSNEVTISIAQSTTATMTIIPSKSSFCSGEVVTFTASSSHSLSNFSWQLNTGSVDGNLTSTAGSITGPFSIGSSVTVTASASGYCVIPGTVSATTDGIPLNVYPLPDATISPSGNRTIASTESVVVGTASQPGHSYRWEINGTAIPAPEGIANPLVANATGTYTVSVKSINNCTSTTKNPLVLIQNSAPVVNAGNDITLEWPADFVTLNGSSSDAEGSIVSYLWTQVAGPSNAVLTNANTLSATITEMQLGTYVFKFTATDNYPESKTDEIIVHVIIPANNNNYIRETLVLQEGKKQESEIPSLSVDERSTTITYFDGVGNPIQVVRNQASPAKRDIVQPLVYDGFGREYRKYLPVTVDKTNGLYKSGLVDSEGNYAGPALNFYGNLSDDIADDAAPYSETIFEHSPLNRVIKQGAPGEVWQPDSVRLYASMDRTIKHSYETNGTGEVLLFEYDAAAGLIKSRSDSAWSYYDANQLYVHKTKDEHQNEVIEYTDKEGRVVCKKVEHEKVNDVRKYVSTYYIYDDFGSLVVVLPPEAVNNLLQN